MQFTDRIERVFEFKEIRACGGCLGTWGLRRTWQAAKSDGELLAGFDPSISEWENLVEVILYNPDLKVRVTPYIGSVKGTG